MQQTNVKTVNKQSFVADLALLKKDFLVDCMMAVGDVERALSISFSAFKIILNFSMRYSGKE